MATLENKNVYVGNRYVPKIMGEWSNANSYEGLSIVTYQGASYTSKQAVPIGIDILNEEFWVLTGNYNAQVETYRQDVINFKGTIDDTLKLVPKYPILSNEVGVVDTQYPYGNVLRYGAVSGVNCTQAITNALAYCNATNTTLYFPNGVYHDDLERNVKTSVKGEGLFSTSWVYTQDTGTFLTFDNLYGNYNRLDDIKISHVNITNTANGLKVDRNGWGASISGRNHRIDNFGGVLIHLVDAYNVLMEDCRYQGTATSTLVLDEAIDSISNVNRFKQCVFTVGKIGVRTYNVLDVAFEDCTFETLDVLLNAEEITSDVSYIHFEGCHIEAISKYGVVNAKMDLDTLEAITPIVNKVDLDRITFKNNVYALFDENLHANATINPETAGANRTSYFYVSNGLTLVGNGNFLYPDNGRMFRTEEGLMMVTHSVAVTYVSDEVLSGTWNLPDGFVEYPKIQATYNTNSSNLDVNFGAATLTPITTVKVDDKTVKLNVRRNPTTVTFKTGNYVLVDLVAVGRWK